MMEESVLWRVLLGWGRVLATVAMESLGIDARAVLGEMGDAEIAASAKEAEAEEEDMLQEFSGWCTPSYSDIS